MSDETHYTQEPIKGDGKILYTQAQVDEMMFNAAQNERDIMSNELVQIRERYLNMQRRETEGERFFSAGIDHAVEAMRRVIRDRSIAEGFTPPEDAEDESYHIIQYRDEKPEVAQWLKSPGAWSFFGREDVSARAMAPSEWKYVRAVEVDGE